MTTSFGSWYDQQRAAENGESGAGEANSSFFSSFSMDSEQILPLFNTESLQGFSFDSMKQSMEAQMPKKILGMGYQQRFKVFCALLLLSALFFALAFFVGVPVLAMRPQKFALSFTCGSLTFMMSFAIMKGPKEHLLTLFSGDRMLFTTIYLGSMFTTLYLTCTKGGLRGYALVIISSVVQMIALIWYLVSFLPGGTMGLQLVFRAICSMLQPVISTCLKLQGKCLSACLGYFSRSSS
ncbi:hypothetical protein IV203_001174 [Nitzschia inconspicua]|uniref:Vesicle transport protein n=1 Tax=Nitzschia inconspicua TaxID=303405 RepID=A0A9K3PRD5_9STRA|nr:hypothetical protein IV203_001174 [Nitzschia inconspicua]